MLLRKSDLYIWPDVGSPPRTAVIDHAQRAYHDPVLPRAGINCAGMNLRQVCVARAEIAGHESNELRNKALSWNFPPG